jgi:hypothetical protein
VAGSSEGSGESWLSVRGLFRNPGLLTKQPCDRESAQSPMAAV